MSKSDSDDDEGFVANPIRIDQHSIALSQNITSSLKQFQPHYLSGQGILRKQPQQLIAPFKNVHSRPRSYPVPQMPHNKTSDLPTASDLFGNSKLYYLAYSRFKQPFSQGERQTFHNPVQLTFCQNQQEPHLRILKDWDEKSIDDSSINDTCLLFDSRFEGGNLLCAFKSKKELNTYTLFMQNDTNTYGYNQWFYFSVRNMKLNTKYTFRIANFKKPYSFFNNGLQPLVFSLLKSRKEDSGWYRDGQHISYFPSQFIQDQCNRYYTLQFSIYFDHGHDYITISPYAPYSYSKLISSLKRLEKMAMDHCLSWKLKTVSRSLAYNQVPYVIISNKNIIRHSKKKIVILARQHSGQTWSSYLAQDIMQLLVQQGSSQSKWLLQNYDFHIFPMLNVDGVIYGNFRCDLAGCDLNRTWKNPSQQIQPQVYQIKQQISKLHQRYGVEMCIDLHTHSKQYGAFAYCCVQSQECRQLPSLISRCSPFFRYRACTFGISGDKKYTARSAIYGLTSSLSVLTIELSAYGFKLPGRRYPFAYTPNHIKNIGKAILKGFASSQKSEQPQLEDEEIQIELEDGPLVINSKEIIISQQENVIENEQPVDGSDSQPEADEIELEIKLNTIFPPTFRQQQLTVSNNSKGNKSTTRKSSKAKKQNRSAFHKTKMENRKAIKKEHSFSRQDIRKSVEQEKEEPRTIDHIRNQPPPATKLRKPIFAVPNSYHKKNGSFNTQKSNKTGPEKVTQPLNLVQFSLKKLPISVPQKLSQNFQNYHIMLDEQNSMGNRSFGKREQNRFDKTFSTYEAMCRPRMRVNSKKQGMIRDNSRLEQQLPFLCVMSENKKQLQLQKIRQKQERASDRRFQQKHPHLSSHQSSQKHHNTLSKIKNKQKQLDLIAKIGFEQYTRYFSEHPQQKKTEADNKFV